MSQDGEKTNLNNSSGWEAGWQGHELAQMKRLAALSLEQKIRWLESAQEMVLQMQAAQQARRTAPPPSDHR